MSQAAKRHLDLASVQSAWQGLNKLVPLGAFTSARDYKRRMAIMDELLDRIIIRDRPRFPTHPKIS